MRRDISVVRMAVMRAAVVWMAVIVTVPVSSVTVTVSFMTMTMRFFISNHCSSYNLNLCTEGKNLYLVSYLICWTDLLNFVQKEVFFHLYSGQRSSGRFQNSSRLKQFLTGMWISTLCLIACPFALDCAWMLMEATFISLFCCHKWTFENDSTPSIWKKDD